MHGKKIGGIPSDTMVQEMFPDMSKGELQALTESIQGIVESGENRRRTIKSIRAKYITFGNSPRRARKHMIPIFCGELCQKNCEACSGK